MNADPNGIYQVQWTLWTPSKFDNLENVTGINEALGLAIGIAETHYCEVIVTGDLNAYAVTWGASNLDTYVTVSPIDPANLCEVCNDLLPLSRMPEPTLCRSCYAEHLTHA